MNKIISRRKVLALTGITIPVVSWIIASLKQASQSSSTLSIDFNNKHHKRHSLKGELEFEAPNSTAEDFQLEIKPSESKVLRFEVPEGSSDLVKISIVLDQSLVASTDISLKRVPNMYPIQIYDSDSIKFYNEPRDE